MTTSAVPVYRTSIFKYVVACAVSMLAFLIYLSDLQNGFVLWDDNDYVYDNPHLHPINAVFLRWAFLDFYSSNWHPLTWISHTLDYAVWGLNPMGHHLTNNFLHAINTFIVVILVTKLLEAWRSIRQQKLPAGEENPRLSLSGDSNLIIVAAVTGILFGIHPLHVESVAWISERKDLLCAMFFLLGMLAYTKYVSSGGGLRNKYYALVFVLLALALLSKPMAVSLPAVLLILDYHPFNRISSMKTFLTACVEKLPLFALSLVSSALTILAQKSGGALQGLEVMPLSSRLLVAAESLISYLWKMLVPVNLIPYYPYPKTVSLLSTEYILSIVLVSVITALCIGIAKKQRLWFAVWGYYVVTLLPVIGIVQVGGQAMADRYTYLPSLGPFILIGLISAWCLKKSSLGRDSAAASLARRGMFLVAAILVVASLSYLTLNQVTVWENSLTLWDKVISKDPKSPVPYNNRSIARNNAKDYVGALEDSNKAIQIDPLHITAYINRASAKSSLNNYAGAMADYEKALQIDPENYEIYRTRCIERRKAGDTGGAIADCEQAIKINPYGDKAAAILCSMRLESGDASGAVPDCLKLAAMRPNDANAKANLGNAQAIGGKCSDAITTLGEAIALGNGDKNIFYNRAVCRLKIGDKTGACSDWRESARLGDVESDKLARKYCK